MKVLFQKKDNFRTEAVLPEGNHRRITENGRAVESSRTQQEFPADPNNRAFFHFERPRLNQLFMEAVKYPLVIVCAGAGYGKTSAVHDFAEEYQATTVWIQISERDNVGTRLWESYTHTLAKINTPFANAITKLGFPDTEDMFNRYKNLMHTYVDMTRRIIVLDDFHFIENPSVIRFVDRTIHNLPVGTSLFLISRSTPRINIAGQVSKGHVFNVSENDLRFTDNELAHYFRRLDISISPEGLHEVMQDTEGWAFAINLIARSYQRAPGYGGYIRTAMKTNIFRLMETEIWNEIEERLQNFLVQLSLIDHLSVDLIVLLAGADKDIIVDLEKQSAYVRRDSYINAYVIHPLFLEFLATKQELLSGEKKRVTYEIAGDWCNKNGFKIDAMSYYEKTGDYRSIVSIFHELPAQIPDDIARFAAEIFDRAPETAFDTVDCLAESHIRVYIGQSLWQKSIELAQYYEAKFLKLPEDDPFRKLTLSRIYYCWGYVRVFMCTTDDNYDFDSYFEKFCKYHSKSVDPGKLVHYCPGPWINCAGSSRKGAPEDYIRALNHMEELKSHYFNSFKVGKNELAKGELLFYKGEIRRAEPLIINAIKSVRDANIMHRALFYILRIAIFQGKYLKAEQALKEIKMLLDKSEYHHSLKNYDISYAWYCYILGMPEKIPDWLTEDFLPYGHAGFIENFANQIKARFCYMTRNYSSLLSYIEEMKQRESFLFGRVEMLAMEACVYYKMKEKSNAYAALSEAYDTAEPNGILMPFIELGKDMRTLCASAIKEFKGTIPVSWLEKLNRKAATYAKRQSFVISEYRQANCIADKVTISTRESEILTDLSFGLSRTEIAASRSLSINTVKMVINNMYMKLGAENMVNLIRIATERKMI
ncbi:MAG: LuxR C-terminal-related transcriptional regulator [Treponema sp.]|jgi:LuxR family maltose regulon positive regulatory protein|nr:LuxR C-terminal-related transcriptional regulator [Treponema sp.]